MNSVSICSGKCSISRGIFGHLVIFGQPWAGTKMLEKMLKLKKEIKQILAELENSYICFCVILLKLPKFYFWKGDQHHAIFIPRPIFSEYFLIS